jgi:hypothetical protein
VVPAQSGLNPWSTQPGEWAGIQGCRNGLLSSMNVSGFLTLFRKGLFEGFARQQTGHKKRRACSLRIKVLPLGSQIFSVNSVS